MTHALLTSYPVVVEQAVVWGDMDAYQHVNNVVYFRYFENARLEYFRRMGWFEFEAASGIGPILGATQARFRKPLTYPDQISIGASIRDIGADRCTMQYLLVSKRLNAVAAEGQGTIVTYSYREGKKVPMPDEVRRLILALETTCKTDAR
jgi:acyl-CoA thioester hydrolase